MYTKESVPECNAFKLALFGERVPHPSVNLGVCTTSVTEHLSDTTSTVYMAGFEWFEGESNRPINHATTQLPQ